MSNRKLDQCEPGLPFWLVEELLDTQTIDGCRTVFGYLESRRERMCAVSFEPGVVTFELTFVRNDSARRTSSFYELAMSFCVDSLGLRTPFSAAGFSSTFSKVLH